MFLSILFLVKCFQYFNSIFVGQNMTRVRHTQSGNDVKLYDKKYHSKGSLFCISQNSLQKELETISKETARCLKAHHYFKIV